METTSQAILNREELEKAGEKYWVAQEKRGFICDNLGHFVQLSL